MWLSPRTSVAGPQLSSTVRWPLSSFMGAKANSMAQPRRRSNSRIEGASLRCARCGYDLKSHALTDRCPECGLSVESSREHVVRRREQKRLIRALLTALTLFVLLFIVTCLSSG